MTTSRRATAAGLLGAAVVALVGCGEPAAGSLEPGGAPVESLVSGDRPTYPSIAELADAAEVVVLGAVGRVRGTELDDGGLGGDDGFPITFYEVLVHETLASSDAVTDVPASIAVGVDDGSIEGRLELHEGAEVVLFLEQLTPAEAPGIDTEPVFYVVVGVEDGAFDVQDGAVMAKSEVVRGMTPQEAANATSGPFFTSLPDLRRFLAAH